LRPSVSVRNTIFWTALTVCTPLVVGFLAANVYVAAWFARMAIAGTPHEGPPPTSVIQDGLLLTAPIGLWFTVLLWWAIHRKQTPAAELFQARSTRWPADLALGAVVGIAWVLVYGAIGWPPFSAMFVADSAKLLSLPTSLSAGLCEEFLFRGFLLLLLARAGVGRPWQVFWSSVAFGLAHVFWGPGGMLFTVAVGVSFAVLTLWRGNVWPAVVAHCLLNLCVEPGLMRKAFESQGM
jgi:membrane protease YdiL (CAAX protease family)